MDQTFDLRDFARERFKRLATIRWTMIGLGALWVAFLVWFVTIQLRDPHPDETQLALFSTAYACLLFSIGLSIWSVWMARLGPLAVTIRDSGLEFRLKSGRVDTLLWSQLSVGVALVDYTGTPLVRWSRRLWQIRRWNRPPADITKEAFHAIVDAAPRHGVSVTASAPRNSRWGPCEVLRFSQVRTMA
jgi:hypothetical protein